MFKDEPEVLVYEHRRHRGLPDAMHLAAHSAWQMGQDRRHTQTHLLGSECDWSISLMARLSRE
jgi:hypothetical protein